MARLRRRWLPGAGRQRAPQRKFARSTSRRPRFGAPDASPPKAPSQRHQRRQPAPPAPPADDSPDSTGAPRSTYRHGDLRNALLEAGIELARAGGPDAVVLREATRRAGVVPNAAYRHFANREALLQAVRGAALSAVAGAMEDELARLAESKLSPAEVAQASVRAVGTGYLRFAMKEPGLFRTAFSLPIAPAPGTDAGPRSGLNPFELLGSALDLMVEAGLMSAEYRSGAEYVAWSSVHGLAMLAIDGPLRGLGPAQIRAVGERVLDMVEKGM